MRSTVPPGTRERSVLGFETAAPAFQSFTFPNAICVSPRGIVNTISLTPETSNVRKRGASYAKTT